MNKIIPGYNGVMDLDLTNVDSLIHDQLIIDHYRDIELYKREQSKLKPEQRYENTIERIHKMHKYESTMIQLQNEKAKIEQDKKDNLMIDLYNRYKK